MLSAELDRLVERVNMGGSLDEFTELSAEHKAILSAAPVSVTRETVLALTDLKVEKDGPVAHPLLSDTIFPNMQQPFAPISNTQLNEKLDRIETLLTNLLEGQPPTEQ